MFCLAFGIRKIRNAVHLGPVLGLPGTRSVAVKDKHLRSKQASLAHSTVSAREEGTRSLFYGTIGRRGRIF